MPSDENDVMELDEPIEPKSETEAYMDWLMNEEGYPRRKARRKAERIAEKIGGTENDRDK